MRRENARTGEHGGVRLGEGQAQVFGEFGRQRLAVPFLEFGLGVEEIDLAGPALHEHEDDVLGLGREVRLARRQRILLHGGAAAFAFQHLRQRDGADAAGAIAEELAAALNSAELFAGPWLIPRNELVQVEEHAAQLHPGGGFGLRHAFQLVGKERRHGFGFGREVAAGIVEILAHALGLARRRLAAERDRIGVVEAVAEASCAGLAHDAE